MTRWFPLLALFSLSACGPDDTNDDDGATEDGGAGDGGEESDGGAADGGAADGGSADGGGESDGEALYLQFCASCHGEDGMGGGSGPPLDGEMSRHTDEEIVLVILEGKRDMPPTEVSEEEAWLIVGYLRELFPSR